MNVQRRIFFRWILSTERNNIYVNKFLLLLQRCETTVQETIKTEKNNISFFIADVVIYACR